LILLNAISPVNMIFLKNKILFLNQFLTYNNNFNKSINEPRIKKKKINLIIITFFIGKR